MKTSAPQTNESKRVGVWLRVSTEDQARGESPEHHEKRARWYAESKGWKVIEVYHLEGVSGKSVFEHPESKRMLGDIKHGRISALIFSKLARLARNTRELLDFADLFREASADLVSLQESIDTATPAGRLFYTMIAAMAHWEREEIASRVSASVSVRAKLGKSLGGQAPFGYQWKDKKLVPHPDEAPVRKLMYELFLEHKRIKTVARLLTEQGYRTRSGARFSDTTVCRLIEDPTAKGKHRLNYTKSTDSRKAWDLKPESEWLYVDVVPVVSEEIWEKCNGFLAYRRKRERRPAMKPVHLFAGLVYCECGSKMYVPSKSPKYTCLKCRNKVPADDLEAVYVGQIKEFFMSSEEVAKHLKSANKALSEKEDLIEIKRREAKKTQGEIDRVYRLYVDGKLTADEFGEFFRPLQTRKKEIEDEIPRAEAEIAALKVTSLSVEHVTAEATDLSRKWPKMGSEERRTIIENMTERITIEKGDEGGIAIEFAYLPSSENVASQFQNLTGSSRRPA